jgi:hypothetical protein
MKRTLDINIAGSSSVLTRMPGKYSETILITFQRFKTEQGGDETVQDIEAALPRSSAEAMSPDVVSKEMVTDMINIMGARRNSMMQHLCSERKHYTRKSMYDPNSLSARFGRALSAFFRAFGRMMSAIIRIFAVIFGAIFTLTGFLLFFTFACCSFSAMPFLYFGDGA